VVPDHAVTGMRSRRASAGAAGGERTLPESPTILFKGLKCYKSCIPA